MRFTVATLVVLTFAVTIRAQAPQAPLPTFWGASIEPSTGGLIDIRVTSQQFTARSATLVELIAEAYGLKPWEVFDAPDWARIDRFTVRGVSRESVSAQQMTLMLRALLAERFELRLSAETRTVPVYALTVVDAGKLARTSKPGKRPSIEAQDIYETGNYRWDADNVTMDLLAATLSQHLKAPVVNQTRLTESFDFHLTFAQDDVFGNREIETRNSRPLPRALENLGLKLAIENRPLPGYATRRASRPLATVHP